MRVFSAYEEAIGFMVSTEIRDKDGVRMQHDRVRVS